MFINICVNLNENLLILFLHIFKMNLYKIDLVFMLPNNKLKISIIIINDRLNIKIFYNFFNIKIFCYLHHTILWTKQKYRRK